MQTKNRGRGLVLLLTLAILMTALAGVAFATEADGEGGATAPEIVLTGETDIWDGTSVETPTRRDTDGAYFIDSAAHLMWVLSNCNEGTTETYRLSKNLDMSAIEFKSEVGRRAFGGVLDGAGYALIGIAVRGQYNTSPSVLFNTVTGTIKNLVLQDFVASGTASNKNKGGGAFISVLDGGVLENVRAHVSISNLDCGGLVMNAKSGARIMGCVVSGTVTSTSGGKAGGVAAYINGATISGCESYVTVTGEKDNTIGGIVGRADVGGGSFEIINCTNYGTVTALAGTANAGGIIGSEYQQSTGVLRDCTNYGDVSALGEGDGVTSYAGGIIGRFESWKPISMTVDYLVNYGDITATQSGGVGGILGAWEKRGAATFTSCANYGAILGSKNVGGLLGKASGAQTSFPVPKFQNAGSYGSVTATVSHAGAIAGIYDVYNKGDLEMNNVVVSATVTAPTCAGGLFGEFYKGFTTHAGLSTTIKMTNVVVNATVKVTAEDGLAGVFSATTRVTTANPAFKLTYAGSCGISVACYAVSEDGEEAPLTPYLYYDKDGVPIEDTTVPAFSEAALTDGTYLTALNSRAAELGYKTWAAADEGLPTYYAPPAELLGTVLLNRTYDGTPSTASWRINSDSAKSVKILWYSLDGAGVATLLDAAPVDAGSYRVALVALDEAGDALDTPAVTQDFEIARANPTVVGHAGAYDLSGTTYTTTYRGEEFSFTSEVRGVEGLPLVGETPTLTISGTDTVAKEPGTYTLTFSFAGNENYLPATAEYTLVINKISVAYPTNHWSIAERGSIRYAGEGAVVTLTHNSEIFSVTYAGDYTAETITPEGTYLTATAEVALLDPDHYACVGEAPEYTLSWRQDKGRVQLRVQDAEGNAVSLENMTYTGTPLYYQVYAYNEAGAPVTGSSLGIIEVLHAGTFAPSFTYPGTDFYEGASLSITYTVLPVTVTPTHPTSLSKIYDGTAVVPAPVLGDAPAGTAWAPVTYVWEKLVGGEWTEIPAAPATGGTYAVTMRVTTTDGMYAVSGTGNYLGETKVYFVISRAIPELDWSFAGTLYELNGGVYITTYNGDLQPVYYTSTSDGAVVLQYNGSPSAPTDADTYTVTLSVPQTENYEALSLPAITLTIKKLQINLDDAKWTYTAPYVYDGKQKEVALAQEFLDKYAKYLVAKAVGGEQHPDILYANHTSTNVGVPVAEATLTLKNTLNLTFARSGVPVDGESAKVTLAWEILRATVDESTIFFADATQHKVYNGTPQNLTLVGADGAHLSYVITPARTGAGTYTVVATLTLVDTINYNPLTSTMREAQMVIDPAPVTFEAEGDERVIYDNQPHGFTPAMKDKNGKSYTAFSVTIADASGRVLEAHEVVNAGTYTFTYQLTDTTNFTGSALTKTLVIAPAKYEATDYTAIDKTVLYNGQEHTPLILLGAGLDGVAITVANTPAAYTAPGVYTVVFELVGSPNYETPPAVTATLTILALTAEADDGAVTLTPPEGVAPDWTLSSTKTTEDTASEELLSLLEAHQDVSGKTLKALYLLGVTDGEGAAVKCGAVTVTILVDEKYRDSDSLVFFVVETDRNGKTTVKTMDKIKSLGHTYDPETGVLTFVTNNLSASYGYAVKESPLPLILGIAGGAVVLALLVVALLVLMKRKKKNTPPDDAGEEDALDIPLYTEEPLLWEDAPVDMGDGEDTPLEDN